MLVQIITFSCGIIFGIKNRRYLENRAFINNSLQRLQAPHQKDPSFYQQGKTGLLAVKKVFSIALSGGELRRQQLQQISSTNNNPDNGIEKTVDRNIKISLGLMGICLLGLTFYPPLLPVGAIGSLFLFQPVFQKLLVNLKNKRITTELLESIGMVSFLLTGHFFLATLISFLGLLNLKILIRTEAHSQQQLIDIFSQKQQMVWVRQDEAEIEIPLEKVKPKDIVVVNAGEIVPVDGIVTQGMARIDQHSLTGESQPAEKEVGAKVYATSLVLSGRIFILVENSGSNTSAAKIGNILQHTQEYKESLRIRGKHMADGFIAPTLLMSGVTLPLFGPSAAMAILWSGFGYNMKLFGPISVLNFLHIMAKNGILIKDGRSLEMLKQVDTVVFDKTGMLTMDQPQLSQLHPLDAYDEETLLTFAAASQYHQTHPIAKAILTAAKVRGLDFPEIDEAQYKVGNGIEVKIEDSIIQAGSDHFMEEKGIDIPDEIQQLKMQCDANGHSLVYIAVDQHLAGVLELKPFIRPEAKEIINYLKSQNISIMIISGDHQQPTQQLAKELGIDQFYAETLPEQKAALIKELREDGKFVAYMGDGINDAIALKQANVSISLCGASTVATDSAQIVLMDGNLNKLKSLFEISKSFESNMQTNFLASIVPGIITLSGVYFFQMRLAGSLVVYFGSKMVGLTSTMLPLVKHENTRQLSGSKNITN